jgi:hypothetical protein
VCAFEEEVDLVAERVPQRLGRRDRLHDRALRVPLREPALVERRERSIPERGEAPLAPVVRVLDELLRRVADEMPVDANPLPRRAAEEVVHGHAEALPLQIPERDVDAGDGAHDHLAGRPEGAARHLAPPVLDPGRILADEQLGEMVEDAEHAATAAPEARLADSRQPLVGADENEDDRGVVASADAHR